MDKFNLPIIIGTTRQNRESLKVAEFVLKVSKEFAEFDAFLVDPQHFSLPYDGNDPEVKDPKYTDITEKADAFFIVTPEYNHSFPGSLKRLLDSELKNYIHKPVGFVGVSSGPWGGVRAVESLIHVVRELGLVSIFSDAYFPKVKELFDEKGEIKDPMYGERLRRAFKELLWMTRVLKVGRNEVSSE